MVVGVGDLSRGRIVSGNEWERLEAIDVEMETWGQSIREAVAVNLDIE